MVVGGARVPPPRDGLGLNSQDLVVVFWSGRWLRLLGLRAGQPTAAAFAVWFRPLAVWLRFRCVLRKAVPNNNSPDRSSSPRPHRPVHASLLHLSAGVEDSWPARDFC